MLTLPRILLAVLLAVLVAYAMAVSYFVYAGLVSSPSEVGYFTYTFLFEPYYFFGDINEFFGIYITPSFLADGAWLYNITFVYWLIGLAMGTALPSLAQVITRAINPHT